jgi:hypothetical protein
MTRAARRLQRRCHPVAGAAPDGLEEAAVRKYFRDSGGTTLSVSGIDTETQTIELSNVRGVSVTYRWTPRGNGGDRLVVVERGGA